MSHPSNSSVPRSGLARRMLRRFNSLLEPLEARLLLAAFGANINFQPAGAAIPSGYLADTGSAYGARGGGLTYGWNADNRAGARDQNASSSPDQRYDTFNHLQKSHNPDARWSVAVPNGTYTVKLVAGDPHNFDSVYKLNVEGVRAVDGTPTDARRWISATVKAAVADGKLTISSATGARNNKVNFIDIASTPAVTIAAADAGAAEPGSNTGKFTVRRTGGAGFLALSKSLRVNYTVGGTATNGTDYQSLGGSVTIPAGAASVDVFLRPKDDAAFEGGETVTLTIAPSVNYTGSGRKATVNLADNETTPPPPAGTGLAAEYFDNIDLTGPSVRRVDPTVDFAWEFGSPHPSIHPESFSARWTGRVQPRFSETYSFHTISDDGVRLWVNNQLLINNWTDHVPLEDTGTIALRAGVKYDLRMEFYENTVTATAKLLWSSLSQPKQTVPKERLFPDAGSGLLGEYFHNQDFTRKALTRVDPTVDFDWDQDSPAGWIEPDTFSVRWTGKVEPRFSQAYTFYTTSDDGVRLWVDGKLVIDNWTDHSETEDQSAAVTLVAGRKYDVKLEYYEGGVFAKARLSWSSASQPKQVIPQSQLFPPEPTVAQRRRTGRVRLDGRSLIDDGGRFNALGATLMFGGWAYKNDRPRLERQLDLLSKNGFDYVRVLGVVGDPDRPDSWDGREINSREPDYNQTITGLTDLAYDKYGLRVEWTLIGDGQVAVPTREDRFRLADTFLAMSRGREHKIMHFEIANEAWQNGFGGDDGRAQLRELTKYMNDRTDILVAASAGFSVEDIQAIYAGGIADIATNHFDRDVSKVDGHWRPVRQPWEHQFLGIPVGSNNEPIGPGSSVNTETDPVKLVAAAIVTHVAGLPMYVFHSGAGVRGFEEMSAMPGVTNYAQLDGFVPGDLASWSAKNAHWADSPFRVYARLPDGTLVGDSMWPDHNDATGAVRAYGAINGNEFFVAPIGVKGSVTMEPRRNATFDVIDPMTGKVLERRTLNAGQKFELRGAEAFVIRGRFL